MPLRSDWSKELCPIRRSLDVVGDPWVMLIIRDVLHGRGRFEQLRDSLEISEAVLSRRLRSMVEDGLLARADYENGRRIRQGYVATESAVELLPVLQYLAQWGERHTELPEGGGHMAMIHKPCNRETEPGSWCSECGEELRPEELVWMKPWKEKSYDELVPAGVLVEKKATEMIVKET
ncbi:winged helix-turn-helix transcriptional regulator [Corynebacterium crudilactis]|uniref:HxlR family transcriptional regulator n=1 Tax=Corynebacterium crudilactis TaxID=1652495 RepID=A0A172QUD6_9CORY|nr:helix-turn-helix domain-containing protein [Corynebacterium crudilactis]ANE04317.1 HxlR family transcriptional regulator [Corynebacterium crudilactis]